MEENAAVEEVAEGAAVDAVVVDDEAVLLDVALSSVTESSSLATAFSSPTASDPTSAPDPLATAPPSAAATLLEPSTPHLERRTASSAAIVGPLATRAGKLLSAALMTSR